MAGERALGSASQVELAGFAVGCRSMASASHISTLGRWHSRGACSYFPAGHPGVVCPAWQPGSSSQCGDQKVIPLCLASLLLEPRCSQSFSPGSTARSESQPGVQHLGIMSLGVPEPTEQLVVLSWTRSCAPCSARELAPGSCEPLGAMSISQPRHCWPSSAALWHGMAECHLPASPRRPGPLPAGHRRSASKYR